MNEIEKAYVAGIIDGEGTVTLAKHKSNALPSPEISIANNDIKLLLWVQNKVNGGVIVNKKKRKQHHHDSYTWTIRYDKAMRLLDDIRDYLIVKKQHADLILKEYKSVTHRTGKYSPEMLKRKIQLVADIRGLNQR